MSSEDKAQLVGALYNWTDDLPVCKQSGVGYQVNRNYQAVGGRSGDYEDRSFHFQCPNDCYLYGIIDGHYGFKVPNFVAQKLPAELLLGQIKDEYSSVEVKNKLLEAFENVQKGFVDDLINDYLVEKMSLEDRIPPNMNENEAMRRFPSYFQRMQELDAAIVGGCSVVMGLIHNSKLYIANVGDTRAVLCFLDESSGDIDVIQLSTDHTIASSQELSRLDRNGIDIEKLQMAKLLKTTRSIGDWKFKGGYKSIPELSASCEEPVLTTPDISHGKELNSSMQFLFFMSQGVYTAYQKATNTPEFQVNYNIAVMIREEISKQTTIDEVAQAVVDRICRLHCDSYISSHNEECIKRDDATLLVRLFNLKIGTKMNYKASDPPLLQKKIPNLTPLRMPKPPPRPPKPKELKSTPVIAHEQQPSLLLPPKNYNRSPPSPLTVTVTGNPNYSEITDDNALIQASKHEADRKFSSLPISMTEDVEAPEVCAAPLLLANQSRKKALPLDSIQASIDSGSSCGSVEDKTKLFNRPAEPLETDANGRIKAYVDFTEFTTKINAMGGQKHVFSQFIHSAYT